MVSYFYKLEDELSTIKKSLRIALLGIKEEFD
jgi:hypothetical protein